MADSSDVIVAVSGGEEEEEEEMYEVQRDIHNKEFSLFLDSTKVEQDFHFTLCINEVDGQEKNVKLRPAKEFDLETPEGSVPYRISNWWRALRACVKTFPPYRANTNNGAGKQMEFKYESISKKGEGAESNG